MTIRLTHIDFEGQFQEAAEEELQQDPSDNLDMTYKFDAQISNGWRREIELRQGLWLHIENHQLSDQLILSTLEHRITNLHISFHLSGSGQAIPSSKFGGEHEFLWERNTYSIESNGIVQESVDNFSCKERFSRIDIECQPEMLRTFTGSLENELPKDLQHLIPSPDNKSYTGNRYTQKVMAPVVQQILQCPYEGMVKRAFLEGKVLELIALVLDHEVAVQQGEVKQISLKPEQLERIYYAREILLQDLNNPPTLEELAHQVGLNDFLLKQGFRQAFQNTVFGELQAYRLEMAKQVLAEGDLSISETARLSGYASARSFARAFRRQFGIGPKEYQKTCR
ncbi:MAG: AraC family transcriptional regulator [Cyanobacteria bacterium P01_A01_bin.17]